LHSYIFQMSDKDELDRLMDNEGEFNPN